MFHSKLEDKLQYFRTREFWDTQPVPPLYEIGNNYKHVHSTPFPDRQNEKDGPIELKTLEDVKLQQPNPYKLAEGFEWFNIDITDDKQAKAMYKLLTRNYVEDDDNMFRFDYSVNFLRWALTPPGMYPEWIVGVRTKAKEGSKKPGKMVGCITGIPLHMKVPLPAL